MTETTVKSVITPQDQSIRAVFSRSKAFFIDIYQREYKWTQENVETLLNDIELRFLLHNRTKNSPQEIQKAVLESFEPYYLNTFLTHSSSSAISIVDGQQRLTTLLLILIKICLMLRRVEEDVALKGQTFASATLENLIFEKDDFGAANRFKIYNPNREEIFKSIVDGQDFKPIDETQTRIAANFKTISNYFDKNFPTIISGQPYDLKKLTYYISYILDRISIVEIKIEQQKNVAMIFEVVNDRGLGLKPYEILKGKLIGNLSQELKEDANKKWTTLQDLYYGSEIKNSTESSITLDHFFQTYFRAKFADSESEYEKFENNYHYEIYRNKKIRTFFQEFQNEDHLHELIVGELEYFALLYHRLRTSYKEEYLIFNKLLDQNQQYLLIMSGITLNDPDETKKIRKIAQRFDQVHVILRLLGAYDSSMFQRLSYRLNQAIRNKSCDDIDQVFDKEILKVLEEKEVVARGEILKIEDLFISRRFENIRNQWTNFSKYILMRIDRYLADMIDKPSYAKGDLYELEEHFNKSTRKKYGMHLEHILAYNDANKILYSEDGLFQESLFQNERNLLGVVLLLKDRQNQSSNNDTYDKKVGTYKQSNFIWNELLVGDLHSVDQNQIPEAWSVKEVKPTQTNCFPREEIKNRQRAMFDLINEIWGKNILS